MRVALYSRVSTNGKGQDTEVQALELRDYCQRRRWDIVEEFTDSGVSGSKESRPALNRLLADAKRRKFDAVLVYRYDRFARSLRQLVNALSEFDALGIHFVSLHEGVDTSPPNGGLCSASSRQSRSLSGSLSVLGCGQVWPPLAPRASASAVRA